jgi:hypothetical protein
MGIIDILQVWNWQKRMERFAKAVRGKDIEGLSAIDPQAYRDRFVTKLQSHFTPAKCAMCTYIYLARQI